MYPSYVYERSFVNIRYLRRYKRVPAVRSVPVWWAGGAKGMIWARPRQLCGAHTWSGRRKELCRGGKRFKYPPPDGSKSLGCYFKSSFPPPTLPYQDSIPAMQIVYIALCMEQVFHARNMIIIL
jgi:hypothetical protein